MVMRMRHLQRDRQQFGFVLNVGDVFDALITRCVIDIMGVNVKQVKR